MRCRRKWDLESANRRSLERKSGPASYMHIGSAFHAGVAANAESKDGLKATARYLRDNLLEVQQRYKDEIGVSMDELQQQQLKDTASDAFAIAKRYFDFYGYENPIGPKYEYVLVEQTFLIPIPGLIDTYLAGTFDGIARNVHNGTYWLVEHKTYGNLPNLEKMETDWQLMTYCWAASLLFGQPLQGALYDGVSKKFPKTAKGNEDQSKFFTRWEIRFPLAALRSVEQTLRLVAPEMTNPNIPIYPNFTWNGCWDCAMKDLCKAIQFDEDPEFLIRNQYRKGDGYGTTKRLAANEVQRISSIEELINNTTEAEVTYREIPSNVDTETGEILNGN